MTARILEVDSKTITIALDLRDSAHMNNETYLVMNKEVAEDLMHALEGWKDER